MASLLTVGRMFFAATPLTAHAADNTVNALIYDLKVGEVLTTNKADIQEIFVEEKATSVAKTSDTSMFVVIAVMTVMSLGAIVTLTKKRRA